MLQTESCEDFGGQSTTRLHFQPCWETSWRPLIRTPSPHVGMSRWCCLIHDTPALSGWCCSSTKKIKVEGLKFTNLLTAHLAGVAYKKDDREPHLGASSRLVAWWRRKKVLVASEKCALWRHFWFLSSLWPWLESALLLSSSTLPPYLQVLLK